VSEASFGSEPPAKAQLVGGCDHADGGSGEHGQIGDVGKRRSQRDHLLNILWTALREHLGEQPAPAVPDQGNRRTVTLLNLGDAVA